MKIVQINGSYTMADSTGRSTAEMHAYFLKQGLQSWVFASNVDPDVIEQRNVCSIRIPLEQKLHALLSRLTGLQGYYSHFATNVLIRELSQIQPDVVVLGVLHNNSIQFPMLTRYLAQHNIAVVLVLHDCWYYTGHCCYYTQTNCEKWKSGCGGCDQRREWNTSLVFDTSHKCLQDKQRWFRSIARLGVVGVSDWITSEARNSILAGASRIQRIYNWIDLEQFRPMDVLQTRSQLGLSQNRPLLLGVASSWSAKKGLNELVALAKQWQQAQVVLIGQPPQERPELKNLIWVGTIKDPEQLVRYYAAADVFINPSIQETFGKTTAEALCCGTPVVAYRTTACTELVGDTRGKLVELGDTEGFLTAVWQVVQRGKASWQHNCLAYARQNFDKERNIQQYWELFRELNNEKS